ncbi:MAG: hypothetical protein H6582_11280 [Crocinitomicaceae bacterium]|nr:hypothetical protein [Crocinitomicaceae bacterium]
MKKVLAGIGVLIVIAIVSFSFNDEKQKELESADKYSVINVQGRILFTKTGTDMKRGDVYVTGTDLDFLTKTSRAALASKSKGRFVITGNSKGKVKMLPAVNNISSRGGALLNIVDLKQHFSERYLILKRSEVQIGQEAFPMNDEEFFYLVYEYNGEKIAKRLRNEGSFLILDKDEIYQVDSKPIPYEEKLMTLYYRKDGKGLKINDFTPVFPDMNELKEEVDLLLSTFEKESDDKKIEEVTGYLHEFYGNPYKDNLNDWLKSEFGLEKTKDE